MFATRYECLNNVRRLRDGSHLLSAFLRCTALFRGICRRGEPLPLHARPRPPALNKSVLSEEQRPLNLLAIVNVHLRFAHAWVGHGLRQRFSVGRKLPALGLGSLAF